MGEVDPNGNLTGSRKHDVYGLTRQVSGTLMSKHGFVGGLGHASEDETGLIYMRARYYDPAIGRFTSRDTVPTFNRYIYCQDNPVNRTDPDGHFSLAEDGTAVAESLGMDASAGEGVTAFGNWFSAKLSQALGRESIKIVVEFVEDGVIEPGMGNGRFITSLEQVTVQLSRSAANPQLLCHELAEAEKWLTGANGMVSDAEAALYQAFQSFF